MANPPPVSPNTQSPITVTLAAGGVTIGTVDIDQATPGTTNGVSLTDGTNLLGTVAHPLNVVLPSVSFVQNLPLTVTPTDRGGTLTTGGTAQNAMASNVSRRGGWIQNPSDATEPLYVSTT